MSEAVSTSDPCTPLPVIANISRVVTKVTDRITGDRTDYPLLIASATVEALKNFKIESRIMYGQAAWLEVMEDHSVVWAGCWGENFSFWTATQFGEIIDLNTSVAHRKRSHSNPNAKSLYSPPILWSAEIPKFYRYHPEGVAELELHDEKDREKYKLVLREIAEKCVPSAIEGVEPDFPNEPILCPGRKLLDDSKGSFKLFDRAVLVKGIPDAPF